MAEVPKAVTEPRAGRWAVGVAVGLFLAACGDDAPAVDAATMDAARLDGSADAGIVDAATDSGVVDASGLDASMTDATVFDAAVDAGGASTTDGSAPDASVPDGSAADASTADDGGCGPEICDGLDNDCNGEVDELFPTVGELCSQGVGSCLNVGTTVCTADGVGTECSGVAGTPVAETCNGLDDDCDGVADNDLTGAPGCALQLGVCAGSVQQCAGSAGYTPCTTVDYGTSYELDELSCDGLDNDCDGTTDEVDRDRDGHVAIACGGDDCDDAHPLVYTGAPELCGDGRDGDCNGAVDDKDDDGDLHIDVSCTAYAGGLPVDDCNDGSPSVHRGLTEACGDGLDNDCDGGVDNLDADGDFWLALACGGLDCDDADESVHPGVLEVCDGVDNDCNGAVDDKDADGDGHVDDGCSAYSGPLPRDDCDDGNLSVHPGRLEVCGNGNDEDCSGLLDDRDGDRDGFFDGDPICGGTDCDDGHPLVHPGATEIRDGLRNDCTPGIADRGLIQAGDLVVTEIYYDPSSTPDQSFEWFEVFNPTDRPVDIAGWSLYDAPGSAQERTTIVSSAAIVPRGFALLCANPDPASNGGVSCDGTYGFFALANSSDEIFLEAAAVIVDQVEYDESPWPVAANGSLNLDPASLTSDNNVPTSWCAHPMGPTLPNGDPATPGVSNVPCAGSVDAPVVVATDPGHGIADDIVRIVGSGFTATSSVSVGGVACTSLAFVSGNELACTLGSPPTGPATVLVVDGAASSTLTDGFVVTAEASEPPWLADSAFTLGPPSVELTRTRHSELLYGSVTKAGITGSACPATLELDPSVLIAQVGLGPDGSDPRTTGGWVWSPAWCHSDTGAATQFMGTVTATTPGTYASCFRFSLDDGLTWNYADLDGTGNGFSSAQQIVVTVN